MIRVRGKMNEPLGSLLRRFKKLCEKEGLSKDIKKSAYYEKPSEKRHRKIRKSMKRRLRD